MTGFGMNKDNHLRDYQRSGVCTQVTASDNSDPGCRAIPASAPQYQVNSAFQVSSRSVFLRLARLGKVLDQITEQVLQQSGPSNCSSLGAQSAPAKCHDGPVCLTR
jgi:hypothetical protein